MSDFLKTMMASSTERAAGIRPIAPADLDKPVVSMRQTAFDIIAEIKNRSPAEGELGSGSDRAQRAQQYAAAGAAAISVLTEPSRFGGEMAHLDEVVIAAPNTPVMRKDFLIETSQILEARAAGASGVLLIVAMLDDAKLRAMLDCANEHGMFVLLEAFDETDLERTRKSLTPDDSQRIDDGKLLFGINTRNLRTLEVDPGRLRKLAPLLPGGRTVAESGLTTADDAARVAALGYSMALVGTALMRADDPGALLTDMRAAGARSLAA